MKMSKKNKDQFIVQKEENVKEKIPCNFCCRSIMRKNMDRHVDTVHLAKTKNVTKSKKKINENNDERNNENYDETDFYIQMEVVPKMGCKSCDRPPKEIELKDFGLGNGKLLPDDKDLTKYNRLGREYLVFGLFSFPQTKRKIYILSLIILSQFVYFLREV